MIGWLLYKKNHDILKPEVYEIRRLVETAFDQGITIRVLSPDQIDIIVFGQDRNSILVDEVPSGGGNGKDCPPRCIQSQLQYWRHRYGS